MWRSFLCWYGPFFVGIRCFQYLMLLLFASPHDVVRGFVFAPIPMSGNVVIWAVLWSTEGPESLQLETGMDLPAVPWDRVKRLEFNILFLRSVTFYRHTKVLYCHEKHCSRQLNQHQPNQFLGKTDRGTLKLLDDSSTTCQDRSNSLKWKSGFKKIVCVAVEAASWHAKVKS